MEHVVDSQVIHRGGYLTFRIDTVERPDGSRATRDVVVHPGAVAVVAVDAEDQVLLVRQYRSPSEHVLLEIPAGTLDRREDGSVEDPDIAAPRELEEETGYRAASWRLLGRFWTAPGFATELMYLYLATDLSVAGNDRRMPEADERLHLVRMPWRDAVVAAERGEVTDAKSIVGLFWLARLRGA